MPPRGTLVFDQASAWVWVATDGTILTPPAGNPSFGSRSLGNLVTTDVAGVLGYGYRTLSLTHFHVTGWSPQLAANFDLDEGNRLGTLGVALGVEGSIYAVLDGSVPTDNTHTIVLRIDATTGATITTWSMARASSADDYFTFAVAPDGSAAYGSKVNGRYLYKVDLSGAGSESVFKDSGSLSHYGEEPGSIVVLRDGTILVAFIDPADSVQYVVGYNSSGTETYRFTIGASADYFVEAVSEALDSTSFWVLVYNGATSNIEVSNIRLSDGAVLTTWTKPDSVGYGAFTVFRGEPRAIPPIPVATPLAPQTPCVPDTQLGNGGKGNSGCNDGGVGWTSSFSGTVGSVPVHPDPIPGELLTGKSQIDIWAEIDVINSPITSPPYTTYRRSLTELADDPEYYGGRKEAGLVAVGDLEHGLGNDQNSFQAGAADVMWSDAIDRLFRTLLADQDLEGCEGRIYAGSSRASYIASGISPREPARLLMRGVVQRPQTVPPMLARLTLVDPLFADGGPFGPRRTLPKKIPGTVFTNAPAASLELPAWPIYGEKSDEGAVDPVTNVSRSKGVIPLTFVGSQTVGAVGDFTPGGYPQDLAIPAPTMDSATNLLASPTDQGFKATTYLWLAALRVSDGQIGTLVNWGIFDPSGVTETDGTFIFFHARFLDPGIPDPAYNYIAWVSTDPTFHPVTNPNVGIRGSAIHDGVTNDYYYRGVSGADTGADFSLLVKPNIAAVPDNVWDAYFVCLGASYRGISLYGSNLAGGASDQKPDRVQIDIDARNGGDILFPWNADGTQASVWPYANTYVEYTGTDGVVWWFTMVFARGPISEDHKNGVVNMAVNIIGREDVGDGTGNPILRFNDARQHWLDNDVLSDYTSGLWVTNSNAPMWNDGTYKVRSSTYNAHQEYTIDALGDIGLTIGWCPTEIKSVIEHVKEGDLSSETTTGTNGFGQITIGYLDETLDPTTFPHIDHILRLFGSSAVSAEYNVNRENVVRGSCDQDPDKDKFRTGPLEYRSTFEAAKATPRWMEPTEINSTMLNEPDQLTWVLSKRLLRLERGEIRVQTTGDMGLLDYDVDGPGLLLSSIEGRGASGYSRQNMLLRRRRFGVGSRLATFALIDVGDVLVASRFTNGLNRQFLITDVENAQTPLITDDEDLAPLILT